MKKIIKWILLASVLAILIIFLYFSIPHNKPVPISYVLKNSELYKKSTFMVEGAPVLIYTISTPYGKISFFALKDATGQIPVSGDTQGLQLIAGNPELAKTKIAFVGTLGDVCVHGVYNETSGKWHCDKKELGIVT